MISQRKRETNRLWYERNKEKRRLYNLEWRTKNRKRVRERDREKYRKNRTKRMAANKLWQANNKEKLREYHRKYIKKWRKKNRERYLLSIRISKRKKKNRLVLLENKKQRSIFRPATKAEKIWAQKMVNYDS